ncbi:TPA: hypothetical protein QH084_000454 [Morganella morganii subsp. morganii]|nr:hypothetical protein [Morganella morganii subsp. morganii]
MNNDNFKSELQNKNAKIIHFSTAPRMSNREYFFPDDLNNIINNNLSSDVIISCSCIWQDNYPSAPGSVGVILDVDIDDVISASPDDSGSYQSSDGKDNCMGKSINESVLNDVFNKTVNYNEFRVKPNNVKIIGLYIKDVYNIHIIANKNLPGDQPGTPPIIQDDYIKLPKLIELFKKIPIYTLVNNLWLDITKSIT